MLHCHNMFHVWNLNLHLFFWGKIYGISSVNSTYLFSNDPFRVDLSWYSIDMVVKLIFSISIYHIYFQITILNIYHHIYLIYLSKMVILHGYPRKNAVGTWCCSCLARSATFFDKRVISSSVVESFRGVGDAQSNHGNVTKI